MINITLQQIDTFFAVAEHLNIAKAAHAIYSSQSALSKTIARFESTLGVTLFERGNRGVTLTLEGKYLYEKLKKPFQAMASALGEVQDMQRQPKERLRIGCPDTYNYNPEYNVVKMAISKFTELYPNIEVIETVTESEPLKAALTFSEVDVIIAQSFVIRTLHDVDTLVVSKLESCITVSSNHPMAKDEVPDFSKLSDEVFYLVLIGDRDPIEKSVYQICSQLGFTPRAVRFVPNMLSLIRMIGTGKGASISGRIDIGGYDVSIRSYPIPMYPGYVETHIMAAWLPENMTDEKQNFLRILSDFAEERH